jgi:anti-sigma B factor antagonist
MDLVLRDHLEGQVPVLSIAGELDLATAPRLRDRLVRLAAEFGGARLVVDLDGASLVDSIGLGALVGGMRRMRARGGDLVLVCTAQRLVDLLALTRLDRAFDVYPSIAAATRTDGRAGPTACTDP